MHLRSRGFTLIELMIVVAVVAILAAIAFPSFIEQVRTSRRSDALAEAGRIQLAMERWRADNPSYVTNVDNGANYPTLATSPHYTFALSGQSGTTYTLVATPQGAQTSDRCGKLTTSPPPGESLWDETTCN